MHDFLARLGRDKYTEQNRPYGPHVLHVAERLANTGDAKAAVELAVRWDDALVGYGLWEDRLATWGVIREQARRQADPAVLAGALNMEGIALSTLGRREQALNATQQAVHIQRILAELRPEAFLPDLASSLNNLGIRLSELGRREQALKATQKAVDN